MPSAHVPILLPLVVPLEQELMCPNDPQKKPYSLSLALPVIIGPENASFIPDSFVDILYSIARHTHPPCPSLLPK